MNIIVRYMVIAAAVLIVSSCSRSQADLKFNPGHYVAVSPFFDMSAIKYLDEPAVKGVNKRYFWRTLEPEKDVYDFSSIEKDIEYLEKYGKQLVVFLMDKSFTRKSALPDYLAGYELETSWGGLAPLRWHQFYLERIAALGKALGEQFDSHPNFEGIAVQESSLGVAEEDYDKFAYTPEKYRDALIIMLTGLQKSMPGSHVFWYSNFLPGNDRYLYQVADAIEKPGVFMGGPDVLPYRRFLGKVSYPMYKAYRDRLVLFCSAQGDSYRHHRNDVSVDDEEPLHSNGYLTMEEIFLFARDSLYVSYLFWDYEYELPEPGARTYDDAISVVRKYPVFNNSKRPRNNTGKKAQ